jgi:WD40 repeat protein
MKIKFVMVLALLYGVLFAKDLEPVKTFTAHGGINDMVYKNGTMYVGTSNGKVEWIDLKSAKVTNEVSLSQITDFMGEIMDSEVFSVDEYDGDVLILSQDKNGYSRVDVYKDGKLHHILDKKDKLYIVKAKYITKDTVLFGLLSNVYILYDLKNKKNIWEEQITMSKFSNYALNDAKTEVATADESGDINVVSVKNGKILRHYKGVNKDEVFGIDWKKDLIVTGGKDKKIGIYSDKTYSTQQKEYSFFIYSVGIAPDATLVAASVDDKNNVVVFDAKTLEEKYRLVKNKSKIAAIVFVDAHTILVASNDMTINLYKIKGE